MSDSIELPISETFLSIQGEGVLTGVPSYFIRLSGCNLRCVWCDTPYASWKPEGEKQSIEHLAQAAAASGTGHVVVTGGEPMIFPAVETLCEALSARDLHITIETAGTVFRDVRCDLMSISPKLASSTPREEDQRDPGGSWRKLHEARRIDREALQALLDRYPSRQLKFVACEAADLTEIEGLLSRLHGWRREEVLLMPEGVTPPSVDQRAWIARACIERGWRYCTRLHIELFGHTRGT